MIYNIWNIYKQLKREVNLQEWVPIEELEYNLQKHKSFFAKLLSYYIVGRYPSFKEKISSSIDSNKARELLNNTEEVFV
ncbi:MAG: hypothetical protein PHI90_09670, partial [Clostridia bacterium]|nr:hypothetical protein [Clostridia bacterium]